MLLIIEIDQLLLRLNLLKVQNVKKIFEIQLLMISELLKVHFEDSKIKRK